MADAGARHCSRFGHARLGMRRYGASSHNGELWASIGFTVALVSALQAGYLAGLLASWAWMRAKAPHTILRSSHIDQRRM